MLLCMAFLIHSFIPAISIAPLQVLYYSEALPTTARIGYCIGVSRRSAQATVGKGLVQGPYMAARAGVEPTTLRLKAIDSTKAIVTFVIVNSRFLQRSQKRSRGNKLIHMRSTRRKSICLVKIQTVRRRHGRRCLEVRSRRMLATSDSHSTTVSYLINDYNVEC